MTANKWKKICNSDEKTVVWRPDVPLPKWMRGKKDGETKV